MENAEFSLRRAGMSTATAFHNRSSVQARSLAWAGVVLMAGPWSLSAKQILTRDARIELIRRLVKEIAVAKDSLPRGTHGIYVKGSGQLDRAKAESELRAHAGALAPGMTVESTLSPLEPDGV